MLLKYIFIIHFVCNKTGIVIILIKKYHHRKILDVTEASEGFNIYYNFSLRKSSRNVTAYYRRFLHAENGNDASSLHSDSADEPCIYEDLCKMSGVLSFLIIGK